MTMAGTRSISSIEAKITKVENWVKEGSGKG